MTDSIDEFLYIKNISEQLNGKIEELFLAEVKKMKKNFLNKNDIMNIMYNAAFVLFANQLIGVIKLSTVGNKDIMVDEFCKKLKDDTGIMLERTN